MSRHSLILTGRHNFLGKRPLTNHKLDIHLIIYPEKTRLHKIYHQSQQFCLSHVSFRIYTAHNKLYATLAKPKSCLEHKNKVLKWANQVGHCRKRIYPGFDIFNEQTLAFNLLEIHGRAKHFWERGYSLKVSLFLIAIC